MLGVKGVGVSSPPYPLKHSGPVLVCGNAWCLKEDLTAARAIPRLAEAPTIGVNGSSRNIRLDFLFTQLHQDKLPGWIKYQKAWFHSAFTVHSNGDGAEAQKYPWVDYWWSGVAGRGTSTWAARKFAVYLGFTEIVLCGMPLSLGGYCGRELNARHFLHEPSLEFYREGVLEDKKWHVGCASMSGWTRTILGAPE